MVSISITIFCPVCALVVYILLLLQQLIYWWRDQLWLVYMRCIIAGL